MPPPGQSAEVQTRLSPEMASFRALVLDFVRSYIARWGQSPSYGEIAAGTNSNRTRVKRAIVSLERKGLLLRAGGVRGLSLPDDVEQALKTLERAGLLPSSSAAVGHAGASVTKPTLLPPPALDYPSACDQAPRGNQHDGTGSGTNANEAG
jgi:hypothetical protein